MSAALVPRRLLLAFIFGLSGAFILAAINSSTTDGNGNGQISGGDDAHPVRVEASQFAIGGDLLAPLQPGLTTALDLRISNSFDEPLGIHDLTVTVTSVDAPNSTAELPCSAKDFTTQAASGHIVLGGGVTSTLSTLGLVAGQWPQVTMLNTNSNQDGCKGATLSLTYSGRGVTL